MTDSGQAESADSAEEAQAKAFSKAVDLLALRPHFRAELAAKLSRRGFERSVVESTLDRLEGLAYLDDLAAARGLASQRAARQGWGPRRLTAELARRGVGEDHVRTVVDEAFAGGEMSIAREVAQRWSAKSRRKREDDRDRLARYLDRRGFSKSIIVEILHEFAAELATRSDQDQ